MENVNVFLHKKTFCQLEHYRLSEGIGIFMSVMKSYSMGATKKLTSSGKAKNVKVNSLVHGQSPQQEIPENFRVLILILKYHHYQSICKFASECQCECT